LKIQLIHQVDEAYTHKEFIPNVNVMLLRQAISRINTPALTYRINNKIPK
ncbi:2414_t:CDS:1, partial [Gigaspora margarita]